MRKKLLSAVGLALVGAIIVTAQTPPQTPSQAKEVITVAGCVQKETDVLKRAPVTGTVGMSDEFVLTRATLTRGPSPAEPRQTSPETKPAEPTSPSAGSAGVGKVYRVTGDKEAQLKAYVGQRVEIVGTFKHEEDARRELGAAGTSGTAPAPSGELTAANTAEITIESIRALSTPCGGAAQQ